MIITSLILNSAMWLCTARSITGKAYFGNDADQAVATEKAMEACQKESFRCFLESCEVTADIQDDPEELSN